VTAVTCLFIVKIKNKKERKIKRKEKKRKEILNQEK